MVRAITLSGSGQSSAGGSVPVSVNELDILRARGMRVTRFWVTLLQALGLRELTVDTVDKVDS